MGSTIDETPRNIHVHLVESDTPPAGVGEPDVPPVPGPEDVAVPGAGQEAEVAP